MGLVVIALLTGLAILAVTFGGAVILTARARGELVRGRKASPSASSPTSSTPWA